MTTWLNWNKLLPPLLLLSTHSVLTLVESISPPSSSSSSPHVLIPSTPVSSSSYSLRSQLTNHQQSSIYPSPPSSAPSSLHLSSFYHTSLYIHGNLIALSKSCAFLHYNPTGSKYSPTNLYLSSFTLSSNSHGKKTSPPAVEQVLLFFGEHGRELISPEIGLFFVQQLCSAENTAITTQLLSKVTITIVANVNGAAREQMIEQNGDYCYRTNLNGVDINRNWDFMWLSKEKTTGVTKATDPGPSPFSEVETQFLRDLSTSISPDIFISIHSGSLNLFTPYAYTSDSSVSESDPRIVRGQRVIEKVNDLWCNCEEGSAAVLLHYTANGNCLDYMTAKLNTTYAFAFEVWDARLGYTHELDKGAAIADAGAEATDNHKFRETTSNLNNPKTPNNPEMGGSNIRAQVNNFFPTPTASDKWACFTQFNPWTPMLYHQTINHWYRVILETINQALLDRTGAH